MTWSWLLLLLALLLVLTALYLYVDGRSAQHVAPMPPGDVIYSDTGAWRRQSEPLRADSLGLVGRPDYLVQQPDGQIVPVELKSGAAPSRPYLSHVMQLAAYCLLVEENYGIRPTHGILQYDDQAFEVDYTDDLENDLLDTLAAMREGFFSADVERSHERPAFCRACTVREFCDQRLA